MMIKNELDMTAAHELALCAENDGALYRMMIAPVLKNFARKIAHETYDKAKTLPCWKRVADAEAKTAVCGIRFSLRLQGLKRLKRFANALSILPMNGLKN